MRFNSWLHEEPYQGSTCRQRPGRPGDSNAEQRWCMAVVSSCREMLGQVLQRAQPPPPVAIIKLGTLAGPPATSRRKEGMTSSHHAPYALGHTHATMTGTMGSDPAMGSGSPKAGPSTDRGLQPAPVKMELLVIADQLCRGECVLGHCTHCPSHHESPQRPKPVAQPQGGRRRRRGE